MTPTQLQPYDVVVAGGGMAGFGAAMAAARGGARVLLVERLSQTGGIAGTGGVGNFCYGGDPDVARAHGRILDDVWAGLAELEAIGPEHGWPVRFNESLRRGGHLFDHAVLPLVLQRLLSQAGVDLLLDADVVGAEVEGGAVARAGLHSASLLQTVQAKVFVDATGDGILSRHAGVPVLPTEDPDHPEILQPCLMVFLRKVDGAPRQPVPSGWDAGDDPPKYSIWSEANGRIGLKYKMFGHEWDPGSGAGLSELEQILRGGIPRVVRHFQEHHDSSYVFDFASPLLGVREGRRVEGDYVLTTEDVRAGRRFEDAVAYGTFTVDTHLEDEVVPPYQIPYRTLCAKGIANLFVVGRCLSAERLAMSSARIIPTCCLMGQAAGFGAALAVDGDVPVRQVSAAEIRERILDGASHRDLLARHLA